jgi:hypothetical protein
LEAAGLLAVSWEPYESTPVCEEAVMVHARTMAMLAEPHMRAGRRPARSENVEPIWEKNMETMLAISLSCQMISDIGEYGKGCTS